MGWEGAGIQLPTDIFHGDRGSPRGQEWKFGGHLIRMQNGLEVKHGKAASPNKPT